MKKKKKVGIFIDGANIYYGLKEIRIDWNKFKKWLAGGYEISELHYFNTGNQERGMPEFYLALQAMKYNLHIKKTSTTRKNQKKAKGVDVALAVMAVQHRDKFDKIIIVSGDYDFMPVIELMKREGKEYEIISFEYAMHPIYKRFPHRLMEDFLEEEENG